MFQILFLK